KAKLVPEARAFHDLGFSCFLLDFRGSGGAHGHPPPPRPPHARDGGRRPPPPRRHRPPPTAGPVGRPPGRPRAPSPARAAALGREGPFDRLRSTVALRCRALGVPSFPGADLLVFWGGWQHGFNGFRHNPVDYAAGVDCPVLLLDADSDPRVPLEQVEAIRARLNGKASMHTFAGV